MDSGRRQALQKFGHFSLLGLLGPASAHWAAASPSPRRIVVVGDSLSAEYGLARGQGWVALLDARLHSRKPGYEAFNASISGDTTAGGRARLAALLASQHPTIVIIELGGNDMLRGLPLAASRTNLLAMIEAAQQAGVKVVLVGMQVPPNFGARYVDEFTAMYAELARSKHCALVPFLLKGVADQGDIDDWFQADRIHPVAKAHPIMLDNVWPVLAPLL